MFGQENIGIYDDFIKLGGDSLTAIRLVSLLKDYNISAADILSLRTPHAIANNINDVSLDLDIYSLDSGCPLNESQLNVYLDIVANDKSDSYMIPLVMDIAGDYTADAVINALNEMMDAHPVLGMCVSDEFDIPYLVKGSKPAITVESDVSDEHINKFLLKPFDLHDCLCRFLVVENDSGFKLFAVFHHIIFDALSEAIFKKDLQSILDGKTVDADKSFLKVSAFTQQIQKSDEFAEAEEFFNSMLADSDSAGVLPDSVRSDGPGYCAMNLDTDYKSFNSFLDKYNVSENILFSSAFAYTLSRFAGDSKVLFNIVENGRDRFSNYDSIGMFVNTLPLLVECKNQDIRSFMEHVSHRVYDVMRYNYYPFRLLANKFDINSDILFQFIPDWIRDTGNSDEFDNEKNDLLNKFDDLIADLIVEIIQKEDNYILSVSYSHRYSGEFIGRFIKTYKLILHGILNAQKLSEISYITKEDAELLDSLNQTEHDLEYGNVLDAFNHNLVKNSRNNLVSYGDVSYSYGEGAFIACEIAEKLKALSVDSTDCIGFLLPRSELYPFAVLGIMSMGAVYVPLDDALPDESIQFMLDDCEIKAVLVSDSTYRRAEKLINTNTVLLNISDIVKGEIKTLTSLPVKYNDLTCILYTSGTTGVPKGVKITRKSIVNVSQYYSDNYGLNNNDVFALFSAIGFDVSNFIIAAVLYSGSCLSVIPEDIRLNMVEMNNYFTTHGVTHAFLTTQIAKLFMESVSDISLDVLLVAGEKLGEVENPDNYELIDAYGPTEAFAFMSSINNRNKINPSSVGHLNYNTKAYVLDGENRRVPFGAVGELCISGYQIADGYLNREYETQKAFTENPFDDYPLLYRTGDMVRLLPDASIGIVGRRDSQVKIRGNRVELSEVEAAIREIDYIEDVTVHTIKNGDNNELVAYVVSDKTDNLKDSICDYVSTHKPDYIVPSFVIKLDSIPLNINGKVDRRALPEVDVSSLGEEYVPPSTEIEKKIVNAFEVVFNQKGIGLNDDFVRLGGDSITAIRLITLLEKESISCRATDILNYKTPYIIAKNVEKITKKSYAATEGEVDLLPVQSYFFDQLNTNDFSQKFILKSKTALDLKILQRAFDELTNIHDMLRATYKYRNDSVVQEILPLNTSVCQIKEYSTASLDKGIEKIIKESEMSLDIENQLIKFSLVHCDSEDYIVIVIHHLIVDGVSWSILIDDLTYIYNQIKKDGEINLLRPYPYKNWVENVKDLIEDISEDEKQHWAKINGLLDDTLIKGKSKGFYFNADALFNIDNQLMLKEEEYLALAISRAYKKTYREDIIFNRESYGRDESLAEVGGTVGWFTSQFPVLVDVNNEYDTISLMSDVYSIKNALNDVKHLGLNYGSLIYTTEELEYKHCPVTFNFLSTEFSYENELFVSVNKTEDSSDELQTVDLDSDSYGISLNVSRDGDSYTVGGDYADGTYLSDKFEEFVDNIKYELRFIGTYESDAIVCALSEPQLGIYLDEKVNEIGTAYSAAGILECGKHSIDEIKNAIHKLTDKHPVLLSRVVDGEVPLLYCDSYPSVDVVKSGDYSELIKSFDLNESLARFYIIEDNDSRFVFYDMHHIICDATSRTIINKELTLALNGELDDEVDLGFVHASRDSFDFKFDFSYDEAHEFYRGNLCDADDVSELMNDVDGSNNHIQLPIRDIRDNVEAFCREYGITVSNLFNAVFAYTYSRFTGSEKVYYTFTEHGRHKDYTQDALGMYVRTIPVIIDCKSRSVGEYLSYVSGLILDAMKYSVYPFRLLAHEFNLNKNVSFEYNADLNDIDIGDELVIKDSDIGLVSDFLCIVNDLADGYVVSVQSCDKYSDDTVTRFLNSFKEILIQILDKDNLSDINYTSESDLNILDSYNLTEHNLEYSDVLDAFNDNLAKYPDKTLVSFKDVSYTYAESAFIAYKLAERLIELGVTSNDCVSFMVERSELYMFSILGILSMGGVYVPLDDKLPDERIEFMINDTKSKVIIVSDGTYNRALNLAENCLILNISDIVNGEIKQLNSLNNNYGDLACILYTSGSTGLPKGVKITRKSIINFIDFHVHDLEILSDDVYGLFASIGFDVAMAAMFSVIYSGACLDVIPEDVRLNIRELNNHFIEYGVTHTYITTQIAKLFINQIEETSLKVLVAGGEKLGDIDVFRHYRIVDAYGPTEACVYVISATTIDKIDSSSVGHVHANTKAYVLDSEFRRVPIGAVGELYLSGSQLAKGYLNRDEETVKSFMNNPFESNSEYCELYCTGDVARVLPDGTYGIVGRRDSQVKIRGNRVELLEVESVIRNMDIISDVTVQTVNNDGNKELVAYVVLSNQEFCGNIRDIICDYVNELKPEYMIPSYVVRLESIPLNVNGKVDKRRLPEVDLDSLRKDYVGPRNKKEKEIVRAFEKVFDFDKISIYDDFIQLGGDSLTAVKLIQYIESNDVVTADILKLRTPEAIAKNMDDISFDLDIYSLESGCPLNASQINVFADVTLFNKVDAYQISNYIKIAKSYSLEDIVDALDRLLYAHPILSMILSDEYEVDKKNSVSTRQALEDLLRIAKKVGINEITKLIKSFGLRNLDGLYNMLKISIRFFKGEYPYLIKGPKPPISIHSNFDRDILIDFLSESLNFDSSLSKFMIMESDDSYYLFYMIHHIIFDATSQNVFKNNFWTLLDGGSVDLDDTFLRVSAFTHQIRKTEKFDEAKEFYESMLGDVGKAGHLPQDNSSKGYAISEYDMEFDKNALKSFLNNAEVSENILFTSVFSYALSKVVENYKVSFIMVENGRDRFSENFIDMTSNVMPLLVDCSDQSVGSFMENVSDIIYGSMKYSYYPLLMLYQKYDIQIKIMFQFLPNWISEEIEDIEEISSSEIMDYVFGSYNDFLADLFVQVTQNGDDYKLLIINSKKYSDKMINDFKNIYMSILSDIINADMSSDLSKLKKS
nr:non-ribosomal peptide synthetase [uncultured Methanobrevibacter sp.]